MNCLNSHHSIHFAENRVTRRQGLTFPNAAPVWDAASSGAMSKPLWKIEIRLDVLLPCHNSLWLSSPVSSNLSFSPSRLTAQIASTSTSPEEKGMLVLPCLTKSNPLKFSIFCADRRNLTCVVDVPHYYFKHRIPLVHELQVYSQCLVDIVQWIHLLRWKRNNINWKKKNYGWY